MTHTFAGLAVSKTTYDEIHAKLKQAGYDHAFVDDHIDMHGIALTYVPENLTIELTVAEAQLLYRLLGQNVVGSTVTANVFEKLQKVMRITTKSADR